MTTMEQIRKEAADRVWLKQLLRQMIRARQLGLPQQFDLFRRSAIRLGKQLRGELR